MNKYLNKVAEIVELTPEEALHLQNWSKTPVHKKPGVLGSLVGGGLIGGTLGGMAGAAASNLHPAGAVIGAALGAGGMGYLLHRSRVEDAKDTYEESVKNHESWNKVREALGYDKNMGTIQNPHTRPLTLQERTMLHDEFSGGDSHSQAIEAATYSGDDPDDDREYFDRQEYYRTFHEAEEHNRRMKLLRQKLGLEKVAGLVGILGGKGFVGALKGNLARKAAPGAAGQISSKPLFPSMSPRGPGGVKKFNKPMGESEFRFAKNSLIERAKLLEKATNHPKLGYSGGAKFRKNTGGIADVIASSNSPKELLRKAQVQQAGNKAAFRGKLDPSRTVKIPTLNQRVPPDGPSHSF